MKKLIFSIFILLLAYSCLSVQKNGTAHKDPTIQIDSTEYEITIIDPEFDAWYLMNYSPSRDYSNEYYQSRNRVGVSNWNDYFMRGKFHRIIENYISYSTSVDYGMDVNRKLYWYFKFTEEKYVIRLLK